VFRVKGGAKYKIAGWIKMSASSVVTVTALTNGASPVTVTTPPILSAANFGTDWLSFPRPQLDVLDIETPSDATQITVTLAVDANHTAAFSDFQSVQGPRCDADLWEPAPEDIEQITTIGTLPVGYGSSGQVATTDGAGTVSWATPATAPASPSSPTMSALYGTAVAASTTGTAAPEVLQTYTVPAGTLTADGEAIIVRAWGRVATNANPKAIALVWGGAIPLVTNDITLSPNGLSWSAEAKVMYRNGVTGSGVATMLVGATAQSASVTVPNAVWAGAIAVALYGMDNGTAGDITCDGMEVESAVP
jgi:hypothetical protein